MKKRIGRPLKAPKPGTRVPLGLRVTAETKATIDQMAKISGRSQSQEAERLIEDGIKFNLMFANMKKRKLGEQP